MTPRASGRSASAPYPAKAPSGIALRKTQTHPAHRGIPARAPGCLRQPGLQGGRREEADRPRRDQGGPGTPRQAAPLDRWFPSGNHREPPGPTRPGGWFPRPPPPLGGRGREPPRQQVVPGTGNLLWRLRHERLRGRARPRSWRTAQWRESREDHRRARRRRLVKAGRRNEQRRSSTSRSSGGASRHRRGGGARFPSEIPGATGTARAEPDQGARRPRRRRSRARGLRRRRAADPRTTSSCRGRSTSPRWPSGGTCRGR